MTAIKHWTDQRQRWNLAALIFEAKLALVGGLLARKYSDAQPRAPAGSPDGGQWVGADSGVPVVTPALDAVAEAVPQILLAGGFEKEDMAKTVQEFVSEKCRAGIQSVLPGQFLDHSLSDILALAKSGDVAARRCKKLLDRDDYRK